MLASLQILKLEFWECIELCFQCLKLKVSVILLVKSIVEYHFPWNWGHFHNFAQNSSLVLPLNHDKYVSHSAVILVDSFVNFVIVIKGIMRRWLRAFLVFQTHWDVTMTVSCRDGCFVLRNKRVGERWNVLLKCGTLQ